MIKQKHFKALLMAVLLALPLLLSACHGDVKTKGFEVPEDFDTSRSYEISFWAKNDTNKNQTAVYEKAIEDFQALYPNISVRLRLYTDYGKIYNDVITNISTDTTPNVCITYPDHIATYITGSDTVVPLDALLDDEAYGLGGSRLRFDSPKRDELVPQFLKECYIGEVCYALPYMRSTEACYINKTFVEKLGYELPEQLSWDFIWEVSEAAMAKDSEDNFLVNGQKVLIPFIYKSTDNMMIHLVRQSGSGYSTPEGEILIFNEQTRDILMEIASHAGSRAFSTFKISGYPANFLNAGQCIFAIDSTAGSTWMGSHAPLSDISADRIIDFETAVMRIPQFNPSEPQMISQGPSVCIFAKEDPQEVLASWLFAQYLLTNEVQIAYAKTEGYVPVSAKAQASDEYQTYLASEGRDELHYDVKLKASKLLLSNTHCTFTTPVFNGSASLRDASGQMIENVSKSMRRKETVDDAYIDKLYEDMISLYRLDSVGGAGAKKVDGPLPAASIALLASLAAAWLLIAIYAILSAVKRRRSEGQ